MKIDNGTTMISSISLHTVNQASKCNGICKKRKLQLTYKNNQRLLRIFSLWIIWMIHLTLRWLIRINGKFMRTDNGTRKAGRKEVVRERLSHTWLQASQLTLLTSMLLRLLSWFQSILVMDHQTFLFQQIYRKSNRSFLLDMFQFPMIHLLSSLSRII